MTVHLLKLAVGVETVADLRTKQAARLRASRSRPKKLYAYTRNVPKRTEEVLDGGSIYWVIKSFVRVRQRILGFDRENDDEGRGYCLIRLDPELALVEPRHHKAFQGWRYLRAEDAPPDLRGGMEAAANLPPAMAEELRALGLL